MFIIEIESYVEYGVGSYSIRNLKDWTDVQNWLVAME